MLEQELKKIKKGEWCSVTIPKSQKEDIKKLMMKGDVYENSINEYVRNAVSSKLATDKMRARMEKESESTD